MLYSFKLIHSRVERTREKLAYSCLLDLGLIMVLVVFFGPAQCAYHLRLFAAVDSKIHPLKQYLEAPLKNFTLQITFYCNNDL